MDGPRTDRAAEGQGGSEPAGRIEAVDIARIMHAIPHRYPFLLIDRVVDVVPDRSAIGVKNVTVN